MRKKIISISISYLFIVITCSLFLFKNILAYVFKEWIIISLFVLTVLINTSYIILLKKESETKVFLVVSKIYEYFQIILTAMLVVVVTFSFIAFPAVVKQSSMEPTLYQEDKLIVKSTYNEISNNDIIVFRFDGTIQLNNINIKENELLIKRVIVKPNQSFYYADDSLYIDGKKASDQFAVSQMNGLNLQQLCRLNNLEEECKREDGTYVLADGWYVVFGDNRSYYGITPVSIDSRTFGLVHESQILGKVAYKVNSLFNWEKL